MTTIFEPAYAKVNLGLDVVRRLPNGYHEVKMIMQTVGIYDVLTFERQAAGIRITVEDQGLAPGEIPADENNLILTKSRCDLFDDSAAEVDENTTVLAYKYIF